MDNLIRFAAYLNMDNLIRFAAYLSLGAALVLCDIWYVRAVLSNFGSRKYVIMPIQVVGKEDKDGALGIFLAQKLRASLETVGRDFADSLQQLSTPEPEKTSAPSSSQERIMSPQKITISPSRTEGLYGMPFIVGTPAKDISLSVGGVEVSGVFAWIQSSLIRQRTLNFTVRFDDKNIMTLVGDAKPLSDSDTTSISIQDETEDRAISRLAYALLLNYFKSVSGRRIGPRLSSDDFQALASGLHDAAALNQRIALGGQPRQEEFGSIFRKLWPATRNVSGWPELIYFAADMAARAGENEKAIQLYTAFKEAGALPRTSAAVRTLIDNGTVDRKLAPLFSALASAPGTFDVLVTMHDKTANSVIYYETSLGSIGSNIARAAKDKFEGDFARLTGFFGGTTLPKPLNIVIAALGAAQDGSGGAYHHGCAAEDIYVDVKIKPALDSDFTNFMIVTQAVDVFGAVQNKGWDCGASNGAALKRALATEFYPKEIEGYATAAAWLDTPDRPNWVDETNQTEVDTVSNGCGVLFLNYMHTQLNIPWEKIVQAGGATLGQTYSTLGLGSDGFIEFKRLMDAHFPIGKPSRLTTDNPFPLSKRR